MTKVQNFTWLLLASEELFESIPLTYFGESVSPVSGFGRVVLLLHDFALSSDHPVAESFRHLIGGHLEELRDFAHFFGVFDLGVIAVVGEFDVALKRFVQKMTV